MPEQLPVFYRIASDCTTVTLTTINALLIKDLDLFLSELFMYESTRIIVPQPSVRQTNQTRKNCVAVNLLQPNNVF